MRRLAPVFVMTSIVALASGSALAANTSSDPSAMKTDSTSLSQPPGATPTSTAAAVNSSSTVSTGGRPNEVAVAPTDSTEADNKTPPMNTGKAHVKKAKAKSKLASDSTKKSPGDSSSSTGDGGAASGSR